MMALPYGAGDRAVLSTQTSAIGKVSMGQRILRSAAVCPPTRSASRALGTRASLDSLICVPVSVLCLSLLPEIERLLIALPLIVAAAYELPPSAMKTARVAITLA